MQAVDIFVQNFFSSVRTPILTQIIYLATIFFDLSIYFVFLLIFTAILVYLVRDFRYSIIFVVTLVFSAGIVYFLKSFFEVARPNDGVFTAFGHSFPSYHATQSTVFFIMLMYIFDKYLGIFGRIMFNTYCVFSILLISFSRVYLGVHWLSDILFGMVLGASISYVSISLFKKFLVKKHDSFIRKNSSR